MLKIFPEFKYEYIQTQKSLYHLDSTISIYLICFSITQSIFSILLSSHQSILFLDIFQCKLWTSRDSPSKHFSQHATN